MKGQDKVDVSKGKNDLKSWMSPPNNTFDTRFVKCPLPKANWLLNGGKKKKSTWELWFEWVNGYLQAWPRIWIRDDREQIQ